MQTIYHELGHAVFNLDHLCESGHIMTGWHGAQGGLDCRGEKTTERQFGPYDLFIPGYPNDTTLEKKTLYHNFKRAVKDLVTLNKQFTYDCGAGKGGIIVE